MTNPPSIETIAGTDQTILERQERKPAIDGWTAAEFFAAIGLMRLGLEQQGWRVVWANDIDENKKAMYDGHFGRKESHLVLDDIHKLSADRIPSVALATASFPCTDLSLAGSRQGLGGPQSSAFWGLTRLLKELGTRKPRLLLIENVPDFLTSHGGKDFYEAMKVLNGLGYSIDPFLVDAVHFVPQSRERLFIVGSLNDCIPTDYADLEPSDTRPHALTALIKRHPDIRWRLRDLPRLPAIE